MLRALIIKEMAENLLSFRFVIGLLLVLILCFGGGLIFCKKFQNDLDKYRRTQGLYQVALETGREGLNELFEQRIPLTKSPRLTSFFSSGSESRYPSTVVVAAAWPMSGYYGGMNPNTPRENYKLEEYLDFDWAFVIGVILSFLAIVLSFDAVSGGREDGTLKLQLSNAVTRTQILLSKYLSILLLLFAQITVGLLVNVVVVRLLLEENIVLSFPAHGAVVGLLSLIYISMFVWIGIWVSSVVSKSPMSLALLLLFWTFFIMLAPYIGGTMANQLHPVNSQEAYERQFKALSHECLQRAPREYYDFFLGRESNDGWRTIDNWFNETYVTFERFSAARFNDLLGQAVVAERVNSLISPYASFRYAVECVSNTGLQYHRLFYLSSQRYRHEIRDFIRQEDLSDSQSKHRLYHIPQMKSVSLRPVDPATIPKFTVPFPNLVESLEDSAFSFLHLLTLNVIFFFLARIAFSRADVR
jgi:ABC-type transport system involved in multi-copper enzyme maturation permease subunit